MTIQAYCMEVNENGVVYTGRVREMDATREAMEQYIGGCVREISLQDGLVALAEKSSDSPVNRALVRNGKIQEILTGIIVCVRKETGQYRSIEEEDVAIIRTYLKPVFDLNGNIMIQQEET